MPILPDFSTAVFLPGAPIDNPYFPLAEGTVLSYSGSKVDEDSGETEHESNDVFVSFDKKMIEGVETFVVRDTAYLNGVLVEDTLDWYAQDTAGNVWYLGEISYNYEYDDDGLYLGTDNDGSWQAGVDGALPGWIMPAEPAVGDSYYQEFFPGEAVDEALVVSLDAEISTGLGDFNGVLQTEETTALEPDVLEFKYYVPGVGLVLVEEDIDEEGEPELTVELNGIRHTGEGAVGEDVDHPDIEDFASDGSPFYVTYLGKEAWFANTLGAYTFDLETGEIGEGRIVFDGSEELEFGDSVMVEVAEGQGLGLFLIPDVEDFALDLSVFEEGGLHFRNILTGETANLGDSLAPLLTDEEGIALPIEAFHALGGDGGFNFVNPAAGAQATELDNARFDLGEDATVSILGFEDLRVTQPGFDGDYNDFLVSVTDAPLSDFLAFDDLVVGSLHADRLCGSRGDDLILGDAGNDFLFGRSGNDRLSGDAGDDRLHGGRGDDTLVGGAGDDYLIGGRGADTFTFGLDDGNDTIRGFAVGEDNIDLSGTALSFEDLTIGSAPGGTQVAFGATSVMLLGVKQPEVDEGSFVF